MNKILYYTSIILIPILIGCEKANEEPLETDPAKIILGKWEIVEKGNWPNMRPYESRGYREYLSDSSYRYFDNDSEQFISKIKYWVCDSVFYESYDVQDGSELIVRYKCQFFENNNKMRLDHMDFYALDNTSIYKRVD